MSNRVKVGDRLDFTNEANTKANITGNPMVEKVMFADHFIEDPALHGWVEEETNGGTIVQAAANGGTVTLTTGSSTDDVTEFSHAAQWSAAKSCVMEVRCHTDSIVDTAINIGWVDADRSTNDEICFELTGTALVNARVTDGVAFVFDTDGSADVWYAAATDSDTEGTPVKFSGGIYGATTAPVASTYATFRVALNTSGDATLYYNGQSVANLPACITTSALLCPYVSNMGHGSAAKVVTVDRITCWQDE